MRLDRYRSAYQMGVGLAISPDGKRLAVADREPASNANEGGPAVVRVLEAATGEELFSLSGHQGEVASLAFTPDGKRLATLDNRGEIKLWDLSARQEVLRLPFDGYHLFFSPNGHFLIGHGNHQMAKRWDATPLAK